MAAQHMLLAVTTHPDGSLTSRIWPLPAHQVDTVVAPLGTPRATTHIPADARKGAAGTVADVNARSVILAGPPTLPRRRWWHRLARRNR